MLYTTTVSKRLQVVLDDAELKNFQKLATEQGLALSEWVRQTLRRARRREMIGASDKKLAAIRAAARHAFPAPDIDTMLEEIERGYDKNIDA